MTSMRKSCSLKALAGTGRALRRRSLTIEDVYDEFSYGIKTPYALKDFMTTSTLLVADHHGMCCLWVMPPLIPRTI